MLRYSLRCLCFSGILLVAACRNVPPHAAPIPEAKNVENSKISHQIFERPQAIIHTLRIPNNRRYRVSTAVSEHLDTVESFAIENQALAVINGGFFDPVNQQTTSYIRRQGKLLADPGKNKRLTDNPTLGPYLDKILNRSELRQYQCGDVVRYDIQPHNSTLPDGCTLGFALGGGPRLLPRPALISEGFLDSAEGVITRDPLGSRQRNARSAIGLTREGELLWVMVAQKRQSLESTGMTFSDLAQFMKQLGAIQAMNLDGGTSSSFFYQDQVYTGKADASGQPILRPVKSVLLLKDNDSNL